MYKLLKLRKRIKRHKGPNKKQKTHEHWIFNFISNAWIYRAYVKCSSDYEPAEGVARKWRHSPSLFGDTVLAALLRVQYLEVKLACCRFPSKLWELLLVTASCGAQHGHRPCQGKNAACRVSCGDFDLSEGSVWESYLTGLRRKARRENVFVHKQAQTFSIKLMFLWLNWTNMKSSRW